MIRAALLAAALTAAALVVGVAPGAAADECKGLQVCIPVQGPWVVIPASSQPSSTADWQLVCPSGVVGGVDALASERAVAVEFPGLIGSPVNPGITTTRALVFKGTYAGVRTKRATSYQPFIGCIPGGGGGSRTPMSLVRASAVKPGQPITVRAKTLVVEVGKLARATLACAPGERLLDSTHSVGLYLMAEPTTAQMAAVHVIAARRGNRLLVSATRHGLDARLRAEVQVLARCAT
ncbi:MAG TPA: hypothetical protein VGK92_13545 [Gaiellales bacterium]